MISSGKLQKYFKLNGTNYLYDIKGDQYQIRWCYADGKYSRAFASGKCERTILFRTKIISKYIEKNKW